MDRSHHRLRPALAGHLSRRSVLALGSGAIAAFSLGGAIAFADPLTPIVESLVTTPDGKLRGQLLPDGIRVFRGVRFAQPPVGDLRFKPPVAAAPWPGTRDALHFAPAAMQPGDPDLKKSEDCLFLNVWTPPTPGPHPVFVWIHGGGYTGGNSFASIFDGSPFAREGIVCVTVAYRLGAFGFLDLGSILGPEYNGSANNGTRDVVEALRWVHRNIAAFGGDPTRVTVGGESAGAKLTATLMALPEAQPLFHSAISESGGGERVLTRDQAAEVAHRFADAWRALSRVSKPADRTGSSAAGPTARSETLAGIRVADPLDLLAAQEETIRTSLLHFPFRPEVDGSYLRGRPVDLVAQGSARGKRLLLGTNRDESALFLGPHPAADPTPRDLGNLPIEQFNAVFARYTALYPDMSAAQRRIRAVTAEEYWVPSVRLADAQSRNGGPTWMYRLDFSPASGRYSGESAHASDLDLVWDHLEPAAPAPPRPAPAQTDTGSRTPLSPATPEHARDAGIRPSEIAGPDVAALTLSRQMHTAWCAFIRGEAPAARGLPTWPAYTGDSRAIMQLDRTSRVEDKPKEAELRLWDGVL